MKLWILLSMFSKGEKMIVYKCDICKKIYDDELIIIQVPTNKYLYAMKNGIKLVEFKSSAELSNVEICPSCAIQIADFLDSLGISS